MQQRHRPRHRRPMRHGLVDMIAHAEADAGSDEIHLLAQLRALVAAVELPTDRLFARYHGRPLGPSVYYAEYRG